MQIPGYRILRKINQGGMSTVYLAIQQSVGREVALKVMSPVLNADPIFGERFQREANIVGQLSHPHIVSIYDIGCHKNLNYIAMDYLPGGSVHDKMREGLSSAEALIITKSVARALYVAHQKGFVHRDVKPENILFREDGNAVLTDFGVAKAITASSNVTNAGTVVGTPHYMSPEQARGMPIDGRSDIYSLGVVFFEMLTGQVPFPGEEAVAIAVKHLTQPVPTLPSQFSKFQPVLNKFLAKKASERFQNCEEVVEAIENVENALAGFPNRNTPYTDPSEMSVMALLRALAVTSYAAIRAKVQKLGEQILSWRWTPKRGFYKRPRIKVTEIRTQIDSHASKRETVVSTRVQNAAYYQEAKNRAFGGITRIFAGVFVIAVIWSALSVGLVKLGDPVRKALPASFYEIVLSTAMTIEGYADRALGRNNAPAIDRDLTNDNLIAQGSITAQDTSTTKSVITSVAPVAGNNTKVSNNRDGELEENLSAANGNDFGVGTIDDATGVIENPVAEPVKTHSLTVFATPSAARIRILNIRERYRPGIELPAGRYQIEVSHDGYNTVKRWYEIESRDRNISISLNRAYSNGDIIRHQLADKSNGPEMVVVDAGIFTMGKQGDVKASPEHKVVIDYQIAVGKYEVTQGIYKKFIDDTGRPWAEREQDKNGSLPARQLSWYDAKAFTEWLSEQTQQTYRLLSEAEWEFIARANTTTDYWWGDNADNIDANCRRGCDSDFTGVIISKPAPVGSFPSNPFGLFDTSGNAAEWTEDCYQDSYTGVPSDGRAVTEDSCQLRVVRGGSMKDSSKNITNFHREAFSADTTNSDIGFRVLLEIN